MKNPGKYKEFLYLPGFYSSEQVVFSEALLFVHVLEIERLTAIAFSESLNNSVSAANIDNSSSFKQSAI